MWLYTDKNGKRCEEPFTAEQLAADRQVLGEFSSIEQNVADGEEAPSIDAGAPLLKKIDLLPPQRALHWRAELRRVGVTVKDKKPPAKVAGGTEAGGSK
jgi:hypothetical protein